ncbi:PREDICTED: uncharacterized protein LOC105562527 [Vollenhovia emeryi]|uniref:uncharacterized protein LOC105562527 n=1 Tax=Vollenhovia emeryi TaxID=411798 RepID=UPI0005F55C74|nr:PREDICTED: uncharacterized protein LOC105562527 [Vollenhovia emeryi]
MKREHGETRSWRRSQDIRSWIRIPFRIRHKFCKCKFLSQPSVLGSRRSLSTLKNATSVDACDNNETKLWDPFRSILNQWRTARSEFCWIEVRAPRDHQNRIRTNQLPPLNARVNFGVRCNRPRPTIARETAMSFQKRNLANISRL